MLGWYWGDVFNLIFLLKFVQNLGLGLQKSPYKNILLELVAAALGPLAWILAAALGPENFLT